MHPQQVRLGRRRLRHRHRNARRVLENGDELGILVAGILLDSGDCATNQRRRFIDAINGAEHDGKIRSRTCNRDCAFADKRDTQCTGALCVTNAIVNPTCAKTGARKVAEYQCHCLVRPRLALFVRRNKISRGPKCVGSFRPLRLFGVMHATTVLLGPKES